MENGVGRRDGGASAETDTTTCPAPREAWASLGHQTVPSPGIPLLPLLEGCAGRLLRGGPGSGPVPPGHCRAVTGAGAARGPWSPRQASQEGVNRQPRPEGGDWAGPFSPAASTSVFLNGSGVPGWGGKGRKAGGGGGGVWEEEGEKSEDSQGKRKMSLSSLPVIFISSRRRAQEPLEQC